MCIIFLNRNAAEYEKAVVSEAKLQVAFEVMNYQAAASEVEASQLAKEQNEALPSAATYKIDAFDFDYLTLNDGDTLKVGAYYISVHWQKSYDVCVFCKFCVNLFLCFLHRQQFECLLIWVC